MGQGSQMQHDGMVTKVPERLPCSFAEESAFGWEGANEWRKASKQKEGDTPGPSQVPGAGLATRVGGTYSPLANFPS